jgi:hypothetical protein
MKKIMVKILGLVIVALAVILPFSVMTKVALAAPSCVGKTMTLDEYKWFKSHGQVSVTLTVNDEAGKAVAHITNNTDCSMPVGLETYKMYDNILKNQTKFDSSSTVVAPHTQGAKLKANIPECMVQIDAYLGKGWENPSNLTAWLIANQVSGTGLHDVSGNYCKRTPVQPALKGSCVASPSAVNVGGTINWTATASGGTGSFKYSWTGTDNLSGNSVSVSKMYSNPGAKTGIVTITSGGKSITKNCNAVVNQVINHDLAVSCEADDSNIDIDEDVTFTATASGGNNSYNYSWTGSSGFSAGNSRSVTWSYDTAGTKRTTVTVQSDGQTASATCSVNVSDDEEDDDDLSVSCYASPRNVDVGERVTWYPRVSGGAGDYDYEWTGTNNLDSSSRSPSKIYNTTGSKRATVTVIDEDGNEDSATCYATVDDNNSVLAFSESYQAPLASAVYLSQVPYTGVADNYRLLFFVGVLTLVSAWIAYIVVSFKKERGELK